MHLKYLWSVNTECCLMSKVLIFFFRWRSYLTTNYSILRQSLMERGSSFTNKVTHTSTFPGGMQRTNVMQLFKQPSQHISVAHLKLLMPFKSVVNNSLCGNRCIIQKMYLSQLDKCNSEIYQLKSNLLVFFWGVSEGFLLSLDKIHDCEIFCSLLQTNIDQIRFIFLCVDPIGSIL